MPAETETITGLECAMCDSENTTTVRRGGEWKYTLTTTCADCGEKFSDRYTYGTMRSN